jgi:hypothetical protein
MGSDEEVPARRVATRKQNEQGNGEKSRQAHPGVLSPEQLKSELEEHVSSPLLKLFLQFFRF